MKQTLECHELAARCVFSSQDKNLIISGSADKTIKIWEKINNNY